MEKPIKTWEYLDYAKTPSRLEYHADKLLRFDNALYKNNPKSYSIKEFLSYPYCLTNHSKESTILKYLVKNHTFNHSQFNEKDDKHWRFWKYLDLSKLPTLTCFPSPKYNFQTLIELSPEGLREGYFKFISTENPKEKIFNNNRRFDNFFFDGPQIAGLLLEDRIKMRQAIFDALDPAAGLSLKDAFPLFDYNKIPIDKWEHSSDGGLSGEYLELSSDHITSGGWSNVRDGGSSDVSLEEFWTRRMHPNNGKFKAAYAKIFDFLENAIIKEY